MNKTAIKNFAIWARKKLIADITYKAGLLGITEKGIGNPLPQSTKDVQFFDIGAMEPYSIKDVEIEQRKHLVDIIQQKEKQSDYKTAYHSVIEEVAYTWFNRLIAVRFMEVNDYLPSRIRVLSSESSSKIEPDLVTSPFDADLDYTPFEKNNIIQMKNENKLDELFRMLFIKQCNALNAILPELFEKTNDYTELLMNVSFTNKDGVVYRLIHDIPEDDFNVEKEGQVEIIGWLYQYYNTEPKDETFALLKKNVKITKERIPAATQLFTPDWIVRYMVENSLGRLWLEGHPNNELKAKWKYYLDEAEQEPDVQAQLDAIREDYKNIKPEDIKVIDPCMGSGHILVYAFDVLMQIYENYGYSQRDAAKSILENNLFGLDIDNRAYQLAYFAMMMKARQYNRRILDGETKCNVYAIQESNGVNRDHLQYFGQGMSDQERNIALSQMEYLLVSLRDAKEYGSLLNIDILDWGLLKHFINHVDFTGQMTFDTIGLEETRKQLNQLLVSTEVMSQKYEVVITNPPYMGNSNMSNRLSEYVRIQYPDSKFDLFSVFIDKCLKFCRENGQLGMMTSYTWMFLSSFFEIRKKVMSSGSISTLVQPEYHAFFEEAFVPICTFTLKKSIKSYSGVYINLSDFYGSEIQSDKVLEAVRDRNCGFCFTSSSNTFTKINGNPIAYWVTDKFLKAFDYPLLSNYADVKKGLSTGDINRFARLWFEVSYKNIDFFCKSCEESTLSGQKWFPYIKGGPYRKWGGNKEYVVNWEHDGREVKNFVDERGKQRSRPQNLKYYFKEGITYSAITTYKFSTRYMNNSIFGGGGDCIVPKNNLDFYYIFAFLNSKVAEQYFKIISPTMNYEVGHILSLPIVRKNAEIDKRIEYLVSANRVISDNNWDSYETSWNFLQHPFITYLKNGLIADSFNEWSNTICTNYNELKANEEELNQIFINIYGLEDEITPEVENRDVTIFKADLDRDIRSFISYAVGCMFGRYSLDIDGLAYAGGDWDNSEYTTFTPDKDNIIPITDEEYFEDDIVGLFCAFLKKSFGSDTLEENLDFIAKALGSKGNTSREVIRNYFLKDFFKDHCKVYQKRPIYWLFDSGKEDGFKALIYMHRYNEDTIGNLRIDYLHRMQRVYESEITRMQDMIDNSNNAREVAAATKRKEKLTRQLKITKEYDEKIAHLALARISIDLDDGVKVNYDKVQTGTDGKKLDVLAKI